MASRVSVVICVSFTLAGGTFVSAGETCGQQTTSAPAAPAAPVAPATPAAPAVDETPVSAGGTNESNASATSAASTSATATNATATPAASGGVSLDRIRAGVQRETFLAGERGQPAVPTFRTEVTGHVIEMRNYWLNRDPDTDPDPFMYPIPSAPELLITYGILKPRAALRARKHRALKRQIQEEVAQVERQRAAAAAAEAAAPAAAGASGADKPPSSPSSSSSVAPATPSPTSPPNPPSLPL